MRKWVVGVALAGTLAGSAAAMSGVGPGRSECAGSHGDYDDPAWLDDSVDCTVPMTPADLQTAQDAYMSFYAACYAESLWLYDYANIVEWTGHFPVAQSEGGWGATGNIYTGVVAFHYDQVWNSELWAHEAAHHVNQWGQDDDDLAIQRASDCMTIYGAP